MMLSRGPPIPNSRSSPRHSLLPTAQLCRYIHPGCMMHPLELLYLLWGDLIAMAFPIIISVGQASSDNLQASRRGSLRWRSPASCMCSVCVIYPPVTVCCMRENILMPPMHQKGITAEELRPGSIILGKGACVCVLAICHVCINMRVIAACLA